MDPATEVEHLRRLLDIQPGCLMRLGADGQVLAANEATLKLLGIDALGHALGQQFTVWIPSDQHDKWNEFSAWVIQGSAASIECDLLTPSGDRRTTLLHAVPLSGHPDGIESMAVMARAVSDRRQLETALETRGTQLYQAEADRMEAMQRLEEAEADRRKLEAMVHELDAHKRQLEDDCEVERARNRELAESARQRELELRPVIDIEQVRQLQVDLEARETDLSIASAARAVAEEQRDQALADRRRCELAIEELETQNQTLTAERAAQRDRVLQMLGSIAEQHEQELRNANNSPERQQELQAALEDRDEARRQLDTAMADAQTERDQAVADRLRLEAELQEADARLERRAADADAERARLELALELLTQQNIVERQAFERDALGRLAEVQQAERETRQTFEELQGRLDQALAECLRLESAITQRDTAQQELVTELKAASAERERLESAITQRDTAQQKLVTELKAASAERDRLGRTMADQAVQSNARSEHERRLMQLATVGRAARDIASQLQQHVGRIDKAAAGVLVGGSLDASVVPELELLRAEAVQAAALISEFLMTGIDQRGADQETPPSDRNSRRRG